MKDLVLYLIQINGNCYYVEAPDRVKALQQVIDKEYSGKDKYVRKIQVNDVCHIENIIKYESQSDEDYS